ncbi:HAD-superfamily hydrolase [Whalleya microplaca]|nr:HAD-superfamily hydrolase [Whalleya microplaca]
MKAFHSRTFLSKAVSGSASHRLLRPHGPVISTGHQLSAACQRDLPRIAWSRRAPVRAYSLDSEFTKPSKSNPRFAFAFDIDGVLLHVAKPIPGATDSLKFLLKHKVPFILLTNGGGKSEAVRVADLQERLDVPELSVDNFVQSHTPFRELAEPLRDKAVLVTGSHPETCRAIAHEYGFRNVVTSADVLAACPTVFPFQHLPLEDNDVTRARPPLLWDPSQGIKAVLVFNDPRDWALDIQIILDLLQSIDGVIGTYSPKNGKTMRNRGWQRHGEPKLYFSNADMLWSAQYHLPRFGQGAFQAAIGGVWEQLTGRRLRRHRYGKPFRPTYVYAERMLYAHRRSLLEGLSRKADELKPLKRVYMIGDNPASDVLGAKHYKSGWGTEWVPILVRTGVYDEKREPYPPREAAVIVDDVEKAVAWALEQEHWQIQPPMETATDTDT